MLEIWATTSKHLLSLKKENRIWNSSLSALSTSYIWSLFFFSKKNMYAWSVYELIKKIKFWNLWETISKNIVDIDVTCIMYVIICRYICKYILCTHINKYYILICIFIMLCFPLACYTCVIILVKLQHNIILYKHKFFMHLKTHKIIQKIYLYNITFTEK